MPIPKHTSASQFHAYRRCHAKWFWQSVEGFKGPMHPAAAKGKAIHSELEKYSADGTIPNAPAGVAVLGMIPDPGTDGVLCEGKIHFTAPGAVAPFFGFADQVAPAGVEIKGKAERYPLVTDYKTSSNPEKYGKAAEELPNDPQAVVYSAAAFRLYPDADKVTFRLLYTATRGRSRAFEVRHVFTRAEMPAKLGKLVVEQAEMFELARAGLTSANAPDHHNLAACGDYGGCHLRPKCANIGLPTMGSLSSLFRKPADKATTQEKNPMSANSFLTMLGKAGKADAKPTTPAPEPAQAAAPLVPKPAANAFLTALAGTKKAAPEPAPTDLHPDNVSVTGKPASNVVELRPGQPASPLTQVGGLTAPPRPPAGINPPDGTPMDAALDPKTIEKARGNTEPLLPDGRTLKSIKKDELAQLFAASFEQHKAVVERHAEILSADVRAWIKTDCKGRVPKRGSLKDAMADVILPIFDGELTDDSPVDVAPVAEPAADLVEAAVAADLAAMNAANRALLAENKLLHKLAAAKPAASQATSTLYIGCVPRKGERPVYFEDLIAPLAADVAEHGQVPHYLLIRFEAKARLSALLASRIVDGTLELPAVLAVNRRLPGADACLEVLIPHYGNVVESVI